jgi:hypothetical protein
MYPKTHYLIQSLLAVLLNFKFRNLCKVNKLQIAHQIASVHEELFEMYDSKSDTNPVDDFLSIIPDILPANNKHLTANSEP